MSEHNHTGLDEAASVASNTMQAVRTGKAISAAAKGAAAGGPYKRYDADVFTGVNRRTAAVFQFHSAALRRLNKVGCQRYEGDYTRLKQKHAERRARRMAG